jgi:D-alanyl-D-alanine carboxypeptidase
MTAICTLDLCQRYSMNLKSTYFKVTHWASMMNGTTADLQENAWMTIEDLLYGLMLPSGNDAATVLG